MIRMSLRQHNNHNLQNYPRIQIDRGSVIKPCVADQVAADQFIDKPVPSWKKVIHDIWQEGIPFILRCVSNLKVPENSNTYYSYLIRAIKYIALLMIHVHRVYLYIYGYFYPYSLLSLDEICDEFSRCPKWTESVIRAFAWHPNHDRCALAICNDYIYVYQGSTRIRVLRHNHQRKIVDMAWQPSNKEVLVVATQNHIILWRVPDNHENLLSIRDSTRSLGLAYLAPGLQLIKREKDFLLNGSSKHESTSNQTDHNVDKNFKLLENVLPPPIVSIQFDQNGAKLYACSPNSSKLAILDINNLFNQEASKQGQHINYIRKLGQGMTKLLWSPEKNRLATATTSSFIRVFEPFKWSCNRWTTQGSVIQDMVWSKPSGRMLLIATKSEPHIYALPFLDNPQPKDVGGNKSMMKALDLTAIGTEFGDSVGGRVQSFAWDKNGRRLAISFKDNPESILLYRTAERPTVEFHQMGIIKSENSSYPILMEFHDNFKNGSLLTICWSDGNCQHIPLTYKSTEQAHGGSPRDDRLNNSRDYTLNSLSGVNSPSKTPRSLTNFCHVSGNNSISSYPASLMPINKVQHQTTLFSLSPRSPQARNDVSNIQDN